MVYGSCHFSLTLETPKPHPWGENYDCWQGVEHTDAEDEKRHVKNNITNGWKTSARRPESQKFGGEHGSFWAGSCKNAQAKTGELKTAERMQGWFEPNVKQEWQKVQNVASMAAVRK